MNKPLTKEEREHAIWAMNATGEDNFAYEDIKALRSAEAYWREAVKNLPENTPDLGDDDQWHGEESCLFCSGFLAGQQVSHAPDCPWKLAQEQ